MTVIEYVVYAVAAIYSGSLVAFLLAKGWRS